jgi:hypothetical protein
MLSIAATASAVFVGLWLIATIVAALMLDRRVQS